MKYKIYPTIKLLVNLKKMEGSLMERGIRRVEATAGRVHQHQGEPCKKYF